MQAEYFEVPSTNISFWLICFTVIQYVVAYICICKCAHIVHIYIIHLLTVSLSKVDNNEACACLTFFSLLFKCLLFS